jgi:DNA-binding NarL/FixJ family response regulator
MSNLNETGKLNETPTAIESRSDRRRSIFIIGRSRLAAEYLIRLMGEEPRISAIAFERVASGVRHAAQPVFIFDNSCLLLPLGECMRRLRQSYAAGKFIVIDSDCDHEDVATMLAMGIHGFIEQDKVSTTLREAVDAVIEGRLWVPPEALQTYVKSTATMRAKGSELDAPTPRERQILELVKQRFTNKEISQMLGVQESTIKFHLSNIFSKLQVDNRMQLALRKQPSFCWSTVGHASVATGS